MELVKLDFVDFVKSVEAFSTTRGQVDGRNAYSGVNLCDYVGDDALRVLDARLTLAMQLGVDLDDLVMPRQTHSCRVAVIDNRFRAMDIDKQEAALEGVDALVTKLQGVVIGVNTADCVPIVLMDGQAGVIAIAHAGWRGVHRRPRGLHQVIRPGSDRSRAGPRGGGCNQEVGRRSRRQSSQIPCRILEAQARRHYHRIYINPVVTPE